MDENVILFSFTYVYGSILIRSSILNNIMNNGTTFLILSNASMLGFLAIVDVNNEIMSLAVHSI